MLNKTFQIGRLGRAPELKTGKSGKSFCNFSMAVDDGYGDKKKAIWLDFVAFGRQAEMCATYLDKGSQAFVEGKIQFDEYTGKDGASKKKMVIVVDSITFISGVKKKEQAPVAQPEQAENPFVDEVEDTGIPF